MDGRRIIGGLASAAASTVGSSRLLGRGLERTLAEAAEAVAGVSRASLTTGFDAEFRRSIDGHVDLAVAGEEALLVFDEVMSALAIAVDARSDASRQRTRIVGGIIALDAGGTRYGIWDLRPDLEAERARPDRVILADFAPQSPSRVRERRDPQSPPSSG